MLPRRVLITGASGFVGCHLVPALEGRTEVVSERRSVGPNTDWAGAIESVDAIVHLAALAHERALSSGHDELRNVNALGTEHLARAAARAGVRQFIFTSTIGVCGEESTATPLSEESPPAPRSAYAASKLEAERLLAAVSRDTGLRVTILRPTLVYGPGNGGNMLRLLRLVERGWPLPLAGIDNRRSLTQVDNLVAAISSALGHPECEGTFIVCDEVAVSTPQIVRSLARGMGRPARLFPFPGPLMRLGAALLRREDALRRLTGSLEADSRKLSRELGWRPVIDPHQGLIETGRWFRSANEGRRNG